MNTSFPSNTDNDTTIDDHPINISMDILICIVLILALYIVVVLLLYEKSLRSGIGPMLRKTMRGTVYSHTASKSQKIGKWLRILCVISAMLCICTCINDMIYYNVQMRSNAGCSAERNVGVSLLSLLDATIYLFLWLRQYIVFESLKFDRKIVRYSVEVLKWTTLFLIIALCLVTNSLLACCRRYEYNAASDHCERTTEDSVDSAFGYIWTAGSISLHCTLVGMFVFPLIRLHGSSAQAKSTNNGGKNSSGRRKRMVALVRRCLIISVLCVLTDVFVMLSTEYLITGSHNSQLRHFLYNFNVFLNITLIIMSFREWRQMLFPWATACGCTNDKNSHKMIEGQLHTVSKTGSNGQVG